MDSEHDPLDELFIGYEGPLTVRSRLQIVTPRKRVKRKITAGVYVIRAGRYYKIGISEHIRKRLSAIQCHNPIRVLLLFGIKTTPQRRQKTEERLHAHFREKKVRGEWYELSEDDLQWIRNNYDTREVE